MLVDMVIKNLIFGGTDPNPNSPLYGIHKFKESFSGELVKVYRYEKSNFIYNLFRFIYNLSKKIYERTVI